MKKFSRPLPEILRQRGPIEKRKHRIRVSVLVLKKKKVYLLKNIINGKEAWFLPGGAVDWGETLEDAAVREVEEELGVGVKINRLVAVLDSISPQKDFHTIDVIFLGHLLGKPVPKGEVSDVEEVTKNQYSIGGKWFGVDELNEIEAYPRKFLIEYLPRYLENNNIGQNLYIGNDWD